MDINYQLQQFGLDDKESKVYLSSLELGASNVQAIAKRSNIHRVTAYDVIERLAMKGLMSVVNKGNRRMFMASEPEKFLDSLHYKEQLFNELMPELEARKGKGASKPRVYYFEGREAVWNAYLDRIRHKTELKENLVYGSSEKLLTTFPQEYKNFTRERIEKGIKTKIIVERSAHGLIEKRAADTEMREVKFLPDEKKFCANTVIYGDRVLTVSLDSMIVVIVEDKNNADNQRCVFNLLWQYLP